MFDVYGPEGRLVIYGATVVMSFILFAGLTYAAARNHFCRRRTRPAVWALATYFGFLCARMSFYLYATAGVVIRGDMSAQKVLESGWADLVNLGWVASMTAVFFTLVIAYPEQHFTD